MDGTEKDALKQKMVKNFPKSVMILTTDPENSKNQKQEKLQRKTRKPNTHLG